MNFKTQSPSKSNLFIFWKLSSAIPGKDFVQAMPGPGQKRQARSKSPL